MKNLKKMFAMMMLVTVMGVSSTFGGVYLAERGRGVTETPTTNTCANGGSINGGVILSGVILSGVILSGVILSGVILSGTGRGGDVCTAGPLGTQD